MDRHLEFVSVQQRNGTVTIPVQARRALGLDRPGAQVEVVLRDGELVLVPYVAVPAETAWFWTEGHQSAERAADADLAAGRYTALTMPTASSPTWNGSLNEPRPPRTNEVPPGSLV
jgi:AbrB family looped-hinge helix DNA binding protein